MHENKISNDIVISIPLYEDGTLLFGGADPEPNSVNDQVIKNLICIIKDFL